jgi:hypothetical protein
MYFVKQIFSIALIAGLLSACSAITDFDDSSKKIDPGSELGDELTVTINGSLGLLDLEFKSTLPADDEDAVYDLIGSEIKLQVIDNQTNVGVDLTEKPVTDTPDAAGEYMVEISDDNKTVTITFYNQTVEGHALHPGGDYSALLHITANDFFTTGDNTFDIEVK